jgi:hypothetical protein
MAARARASRGSLLPVAAIKHQAAFSIRGYGRWEGGPLVRTTKRLLGHDPLKILFPALDAIAKAPVGLYRQQREDRIDVALLDDIAALRSVNLAGDMVVDMIGVLHRGPRLQEWAAASDFPASHWFLNRLEATLQHLFSVRVTKVGGFLRPRPVEERIWSNCLGPTGRYG